MRIAGVLLAAGGGARMGAAKQLLAFRGSTLVRCAAEALLASRCDATFAVLGARADEVARALEGLAVQIVENTGWQEGLAASIRAGVAAAECARPPFDAALLALADQPHVGAALLDELIAEFERAGGAPVACEYAGSVGAPALFPRRDFPALRALEADRGARALLLERRDELRRIPFEAAAIDVDTREDYERLLEESNRAPGGPHGPGAGPSRSARPSR